MNEDSKELIAFLTNSYMAEPTPEHSQRLWREVFKLEGWYLILSVTMEGISPLVGTLDDEMPYLAAWTDLDTLREYAEKSGLELNEGEFRYLFIPLPQVLEFVLGHEEKGVYGIRYNPPLGWSVPLSRLRMVAEAMGVEGSKKEKVQRQK